MTEKSMKNEYSNHKTAAADSGRIETIMNALVDKNQKLLASCFAEDCTFIDYCPSQNGDTNSFVYGSDCMEMYFNLRFKTGEFEAAEPVIEGTGQATFFGMYNGPYVYARLRIEEYDNDGRVKKAVVSPA